jgi:hypothetical protein
VPLADAVSPWHDFYMLVGTASATLVGLLFVAVSVGFHTRDKHPALRAFVSPSVVHFTSVLVACLIAIAPIRDWMILGPMVGGEGLFGVVYAGLVWRSMVRHGFTASIDLEDRVWYAALPAVGYAILAGAGVDGAAADRRHPQCLGHHGLYRAPAGVISRFSGCPWANHRPRRTTGSSRPAFQW